LHELERECEINEEVMGISKHLGIRTQDRTRLILMTNDNDNVIETMPIKYQS